MVLKPGAGTLHAGVLDVQRCLFNLHRKLMPTSVLRQKAQKFVEAGLIDYVMAERTIQTIVSDRNEQGFINDCAAEEGQAEGAAPANNLASKLNQQQLEELLARRVAMMQKGRVSDDGEHSIGVTDQFRIRAGRNVVWHVRVRRERCGCSSFAALAGSTATSLTSWSAGRRSA